jgi:phage shock protein E
MKTRGLRRLAALCAGLLFFSALARAQLPPDAVWIDVRSPAEYEEAHLEQARLIPFDGIEAGVSGLNMPKDTPIYLYCAVGGRAEVARRRLEAMGYTKVTNVGSLENARELAE